MKKGFYYFEVLGQYTITYFHESHADMYYTKGVATISNDVELENKDSYILKKSKTLNHYHFISDRPYKEWKYITLSFVFNYYE